MTAYATVQIRIDIGGADNTPHTFLHITGPDGTSVEYGFRPVEGLTPYGEGMVEKTSGHEAQFSTYAKELTPQQYSDLMSNIQRSSIDPPYYSLTEGSVPVGKNSAQCTTWARSMLKDSNIGLPEGMDWTTNPYGQALFDTIYDFFANNESRGGMTWEQFKSFLSDVYDILPQDYKDLVDKIRDYYDRAHDFVDRQFEGLRDVFEKARTFVPRRDPLTLDLDGDGIETVAATGNLLFDHDGDGVSTGTGWVKSDDGLLVLDRNGNGKIDDGTELFGADTLLADGSKATSGFAALAELDSNKDEIFSALDAQFGDVRVWRDLDQNGVSNFNELFTLEQLGILSINLTPSTTTDLDLRNGNVVDNRGSYTRTDGSTGLVGDLLLATNSFYRDFSGSLEPVPVNEAAQKLVDMEGRGAVRDLREAASLSPELLAMVQGLVPGMSRDAMLGALDAIVASWAATSAMQSSEEVIEHSGAIPRSIRYHGTVPPSVLAQGQAAVQAWKDQQHLELAPIIGILEKFNGSSLVSWQDDQVTTGGSSYKWQTITRTDGSTHQIMDILLQADQLLNLNKAYAALKDSIYGGLVLSTRLSGYLSEIDMAVHNGRLVFDNSGVCDKLVQKTHENNVEALQDALDLYRYGEALQSFGWDGLQALRQVVDVAAVTDGGLSALKMAGINFVQGQFSGTLSDDLIFGGASIDVIRGGGGHDVILGGAGDDELYGEQGDDELYGNEGNDVLNGGAGYNKLYGGAGNDVMSVDAIASNNLFVGGTGNDQMTGSRYSDRYEFALGDGQDTIIEQDSGYSNTDVLAFGAGISASDIKVLRSGNDLVFQHVNGTDSVRIKDQFTATTWNTTKQVEQVVFADGTVWTVASIQAAGVTTVGSEGDDVIGHFSAGKDILIGGAGNDTITGGTSDVLMGGAGDDVLVVEAAASNAVFVGGTGNDQMTGSRYSDRYEFALGDGQDTIIERFDGYSNTDVLAFGSGISASDIRVIREGSDLLFRHINGTDSVRIKDQFTGATWNVGNQIEQVTFADGTVWTVANWMANGLPNQGDDGDNTLLGHTGNDTMSGGAGNDTMVAYGGTNKLYGGAGNDVMSVDATASNNLFVGGTGNDQMTGSRYSDRYEFALGDGQDTIIEQDSGYSNTDVLAFGAGISASDIKVLRSGNDLVFQHVNGTDSVRIKDQFTATTWNKAKQVEQVTFTDGTVWTVASIQAAGVTTVGSEGDDVIGHFSAGRDILIGGAGNDTITGGTSDVLMGGAGDDVLAVEAAASNAVFVGGTGNDQMTGSRYSDRYEFALGDGQDTIIEQDSGYSNTDVLAFGNGIEYDKLWFERTGSDLLINLIGSEESVRVKDWYSGKTFQVERIELSDGKYLTNSETDLLVSAMAGFARPSAADSSIPESYRDDLLPKLIACW